MNILKKFHHKKIVLSVKALLWFSLGAILGLFFFASFLFIFYRNAYANVIYPGVFVNDVDFGGKTEKEVTDYFDRKNEKIAGSQFIFKAGDKVATVSAQEIELGYDSELLSHQAFSIGRSNNILSNLSLIFQAYTAGIRLPPAYHYSEDVVDEALHPIDEELSIKPVNANFAFENGRVVAFRSHQNGQKADVESAKEEFIQKIPETIKTERVQIRNFPIPIKVIQPTITTEKVNNMGIKELVATGTSLFFGSIPNRIYNIKLASSRINGVLVKPDEVFSFAKVVGDVSNLTGYKQAYVIQNGRTVLGDGGGVCQVSTTLFRAALRAGLPIIERNQHAYRVHYYEEDSGPGIDAAVYVPSVDLRFKNDTKNWLLIQSSVDEQAMRLTFEIYGAKDGREVTINDPVILSQTPAPEPLRQDDPTLPKGEVKQVDWAAAGAKVYFTREVKKDGKTIISDKFVSNFRPWQAVYLVGTKE